MPHSSSFSHKAFELRQPSTTSSKQLEDFLPAVRHPYCDCISQPSFLRVIPDQDCCLCCRGLSSSSCGSAERGICKQNVGLCAISEALQFTSCLARGPEFCLDAKLRLSCQSQCTSPFSILEKGFISVKDALSSKHCSLNYVGSGAKYQREIKVCTRIKPVLYNRPN